MADTDNDVVVYFNNKYYMIQENQWKKEQNIMAASTVDQKAEKAIEHGKVVAYFPGLPAGTPATPGVGAYSTVINLAKIIKEKIVK